MQSYVPLSLHVLTILAGVVAYTVLTALGHDGNTVLGAVLAYGTGAGTQALIPVGASAVAVPPSTATAAPPQAPQAVSATTVP